MAGRPHAPELGALRGAVNVFLRLLCAACKIEPESSLIRWGCTCQQPTVGKLVLLADGDVPVKFSLVPVPGSATPPAGFEFSNFKTEFDGLGLFDAHGNGPDYDEYMNPTTCTSDPADLANPAAKTVYIFHPSKSFDIAGQVSHRCF